MGLLSLALFHLSPSNIYFLKTPQIDKSCFEILFASDENDEIRCLRCCFAATSVTILSGRPTENDRTLMSSYLDGTVAEGRPNETIAEDGTIELDFESPEAQAKWMRQEDRRRKGLPLTTTTEMPTTTSSSEATMWNPDNVFVNCWMC